GNGRYAAGRPVEVQIGYLATAIQAQERPNEAFLFWRQISVAGVVQSPYHPLPDFRIAWKNVPQRGTQPSGGTGRDQTPCIDGRRYAARGMDSRQQFKKVSSTT